MRREFILPILLLVAGIAVTGVNMALGWNSDVRSGLGGTYVGPVIVFLGLVSFGRAWHGKAPAG